jgi:hypothetical protein
MCRTSVYSIARYSTLQFTIPHKRVCMCVVELCVVPSRHRHRHGESKNAEGALKGCACAGCEALPMSKRRGGQRHAVHLASCRMLWSNK